MSAYDDPNSRMISVRVQRQRQYTRWVKQGKYEELLADYLKNRCAAPDVWKAFEMLRQAGQAQAKEKR